MALLRHLGGVAGRIGVRFVVLKGGALHALRLVRAAERPLSDVDLLLAPADGKRLHEELLGEGWTVFDAPVCEWHLPQLVHEAWPALEIHDALDGITRDGTSWATFADLEEEGALEPLPAAGPSAFVPTREVLAAHAVAHGFLHHGLVPLVYPLRRVFDDLRVLGVLEAPDEAFLAGPGRWIGKGLTRGEIVTILRLSRRLARGEEVASDSPPTPESRLLLHVDRCAGDPLYRNAFRLRQVHALAGGLSLRGVARNVAGTLFLSRAEVDARYGPPRHAWGYPLRQLLRPLDLALRLGRYAGAWLRLRVRGEEPPPDRARAPRAGG